MFKFNIIFVKPSEIFQGPSSFDICQNENSFIACAKQHFLIPTFFPRNFRPDKYSRSSLGFYYDFSIRMLTKARKPSPDAI